jgi:hypothetical protein
MNHELSPRVIAGLDPAIHEAVRRRHTYVSQAMPRHRMDARVKPGHDVESLVNKNKVEIPED